MTKPTPSRPRAANDTPPSTEAEARHVPPDNLAPVWLGFEDDSCEREPPRLASQGCPAGQPASPLKIAETMEEPCLHADGVECHFRKICESIAEGRRKQ